MIESLYRARMGCNPCLVKLSYAIELRVPSSVVQSMSCEVELQLIERLYMPVYFFNPCLVKLNYNWLMLEEIKPL